MVLLLALAVVLCSVSLKGMPMAIITVIISTMLAMIFPMDNIMNFLYFIGSVFAPMTAVLLTDYFYNHTHQNLISISNIMAWVVGFGLYHYFLNIEFTLGATLPAMIGASIVCFLLKVVKKET